MTAFVITLLGLTGVTILIQLITRTRIVGGNELGVVSGKGGKKGFRSFSGVVPLNVKATVSFAIASNEAGRELGGASDYRQHNAGAGHKRQGHACRKDDQRL